MDLALHRTALDSLTAQLAVLDTDGSLVLVNDTWRRFADGAGCTTCNEGANFFDVCARASGSAAGDAARASEGVHGVLAGERPSFAMDVRCDTPEGTLWYHQEVVPVAGDPGGALLGYTDITARKELEDLTRHRATHDTLTGLPNRLLIHDRLSQALSAGRRSGAAVAVLFVDVDRFKAVNDLHGHATGDAALVEVARRLRASVRPGDTVGRLAGDEFVVVAAPADGAVAAEIARRLREAMAAPVHVGGRRVALGVSVGVHVSRRWEETPDEVLQLADLAMFRAKRSRPAGAEASSPSGDDAEEAFSVQRLLHLLRVSIGMEAAWTTELVDDRQVFRFVDTEPGRPGPTPGASHPAGTYGARAVEETLPALVRDAHTDVDGGLLAVTFEWHVGAYLGVPLRGPAGLPVGMLAASSSAPMPQLGEGDVTSARLVADVVADLHRRALRAAASEDRQRDLRRTVVAICRGAGRQVVLQPIVDLREGVLVAAEALTRFADTTRGPAQWFATATALGLGRDLEVATARAALERARTAALPAISVNLSPDVIVDGGLDELLAGHDPTRVILEVTEHAAVASYDRLQQAVGPHRARGLRLAIDDVGAGYASMQHVLRIRPDILKIDMSLVRDLDRDPVRRALVAAIESFSRHLDATIVAEGVETVAERRALLDIGVDLAQGYLIGRPSATLPRVARRQPSDRQPGVDHPGWST